MEGEFGESWESVVDGEEREEDRSKECRGGEGREEDRRK